MLRLRCYKGRVSDGYNGLWVNSFHSDLFDQMMMPNYRKSKEFVLSSGMHVPTFPVLESALKFPKKLDLKPGGHVLFIVIDDDPAACVIDAINIRRAFRISEVLSFTDPQEGLKFMYNLRDLTGNYEAIVAFIDLNMPFMTGFDILERLTNFRTWLPPELNTYVLSSSVDSKDVERTLRYDITSGFICKPLTIERLNEVFGSA